MGWGGLNLVATLGALIFAAGVLLYVDQRGAQRSRTVRPPAPIRGAADAGVGDRVAAAALQLRAVPVVHGRDPMWEPAPRRPAACGAWPPTTASSCSPPSLDARPDSRMSFPEPTIWPFMAAVATTVLFVGSIFTPWAVVWASIPLAIALALWFWPGRRETAHELAVEEG